MFCYNCGKQINDGAGFCPYCGAKLNQSAPQEPNRQNTQTQGQGQYQPGSQNTSQYQGNTQGQAGNQQQYNPYHPNVQEGYQNPAKKPVNKKLPLIIGIAAAAAAIVLILIFVVFKPFGGGSTGSPEGTLKKLETALNNFDIEEMIKCCDSEIQEEAGEIELYTSQIEQAKSYIDMLGADFNFTFTGHDFNYTVDDGVQYCTCDVDMTYTISMLGQEQSRSDTMTVTFVNENGQWLLSGDKTLEDLFGSMF
jgi:uncharacterized membrane protein YvbJ